jgi:hypothetical protein
LRCAAFYWHSIVDRRIFLRKTTRPQVDLITWKGGRARRYFWALAWFLVLTSIFSIAYNQSPLYTSNQNQYFLHGYAQAGVGNLSEDWLANTADPTPVFSSLVKLTIRLFHNENIFFVYYALLMGIYLFSLIGIVDQVFPIRISRLRTHFFFVAIILLHSTVLRFLLLRLFGGDWPYIFEGGVAGQRLLGPVFQPSTFGVFLLLSIYLYLRDRKNLAVLSAVLAATFHPTYLLSAAALTLAFLIDTFRLQKKIIPVFRLAILALVAVAPILIYSIGLFWGANSNAEIAARDILVNYRIPAHAIVSRWFNGTVVIKLAFLGLALFLVRHHRLFGLMLVPLSLSIGLTILQVISQNTSLALIFPWRLTTWLVPVAVGLIVAMVVTGLDRKITGSLERPLRTAGLVLIGLAMIGGMLRTFLEKVESTNFYTRPLEMYVAAHPQTGQVVLTPSNLFDFRLETGVPIFVDFLSVPYQGADVVEWYQRFLLASQFYRRGNCIKLPDFYALGVTQVILPVTFPMECPQLIEIYADRSYRLFKLIP